MESCRWKNHLADIASRGASPLQIAESNWLKGPSHLQDPGKTQLHRGYYNVDAGDKEVKEIVTHATISKSSIFVDHLS